MRNKQVPPTLRKEENLSSAEALVTCPVLFPCPPGGGRWGCDVDSPTHASVCSLREDVSLTPVGHVFCWHCFPLVNTVFWGFVLLTYIVTKVLRCK